MKYLVKMKMSKSQFLDWTNKKISITRDDVELDDMPEELEDKRPLHREALVRREFKKESGLGPIQGPIMEFASLGRPFTLEEAKQIVPKGSGSNAASDAIQTLTNKKEWLVRTKIYGQPSTWQITDKGLHRSGKITWAKPRDELGRVIQPRDTFFNQLKKDGGYSTRESVQKAMRAMGHISRDDKVALKLARRGYVTVEKEGEAERSAIIGYRLTKEGEETPHLPRQDEIEEAELNVKKRYGLFDRNEGED